MPSLAIHSKCSEKSCLHNLVEREEKRKKRKEVEEKGGERKGET